MRTFFAFLLSAVSCFSADTQLGNLVISSWSDNQAKRQSDYATTFTNALTAYTAIISGTNAVAISNAVAPVWNPPAVQTVPAWLQKRGVQ